MERSDGAPFGRGVLIRGAPPPTQGYFSLFAQRKVTKRKRSPDAALFLRSAALGPTLSHATPVAGDSRPRPVGDPYRALTQSLSVLRRGIGGFNVNTNRQSHAAQFSPSGFRLDK